MSFYFLILVAIHFSYLFIRYKKINTKSTINSDTSFKILTKEAVSPPQEHHVIVGYKSPMKYFFYPVYIFHSKESLELYKNIIVEYLMIEEPFHTSFVQILLFLDKNDDCVKSNCTQEFKLKIRNSCEKGSAYMVYSIKELIFETLLSVFQDGINIYKKNSLQALLLATTFVYMQKMRKWSYLSNETEDEVEQCILIAKYFMKNGSSQRVFMFDMIKKIKENDGEFSFVNYYFERAKQFAKEFPYVQYQDGEQKLLPGSISIHSKKSLYTIGDFGV